MTILHKIRKLRAGWYFWAFPLFAVGLTAWLMIDYFQSEGPRVRIYFDEAAGVEAEKTPVRFRGVNVGLVKSVSVSLDRKSVIAEVLLRREAKDLAVEGSRFSLVTPKVNLEGISGLDTLFEGVYISLLPGPASARVKRSFHAYPNVPPDAMTDTSTYLLITDNASSLNSGDSVTYRGMKIGTVTSLNFDKAGRNIQLIINVENQFVRLIRTNTVFWRKVGIDAKLGLFNSEIKMDSIDALMKGGIEIATPTTAGPQAKALERFTLASEPPKDYAKWVPNLAD